MHALYTARFICLLMFMCEIKCIKYCDSDDEMDENVKCNSFEDSFNPKKVEGFKLTNK